MAYIFKILLILFDNNVVNMVDFSETRHISLPIKGGGVQAYHFGKRYSELGVGGEGQDTSKQFEGSFGSIRAILAM